MVTDSTVQEASARVAGSIDDLGMVFERSKASGNVADGLFAIADAILKLAEEVARLDRET